MQLIENKRGFHSTFPEPESLDHIDLSHAARLICSKGNDFLTKYDEAYIERLQAIHLKLENAHLCFEDRIRIGVFLLISMIDAPSQNKLDLITINRPGLLELINAKNTLGYGENEERMRELAIKTFDFLLEKDFIIPLFEESNKNLETNLNTIEYLLFYFYKLNVYHDKSLTLTKHIISLLTLLSNILKNGGDFIQKPFRSLVIDFEEFCKTLPPEICSEIQNAQLAFAIQIDAKNYRKK